MICYDTTDSWQYYSTTIREANASGVCGVSRVAFVIGVSEDLAQAVNYSMGASSTSTNYGQWIGIGLNSTTAFSNELKGREGKFNSHYTGQFAFWRDVPPVGFNYLARLEAADSSAVMTFVGDGGNNVLYQTGMLAEVLA
jgi:hypothetical protein